MRPTSFESDVSNPLDALDWREVAKRQYVVVISFIALLAALILTLYSQDRRHEWRLRQEQATHRLDLSQELILTELERVQADALFMAELNSLRDFVSDIGDELLRRRVESEFVRFVTHKRHYNQIRLLDLSGREIVRVDYSENGTRVVPGEELQDKRDRYYVSESSELLPGSVFVSEFDLNQEHNQIERPVNPVIRFVSPVVGVSGEKLGLLVLNYLGSRLLQELEGISLPGHTMLLRSDGHFLMSPDSADEWGWLLGHDRSFARVYPAAWPGVQCSADSLTEVGYVASLRVRFLPTEQPVDGTGTVSAGADAGRFEVLLVSMLPRPQVWALSNQLLGRLLLLAGLITLPFSALARFWAIASVRRRQQHTRILASEKQLRELSARLLRIQEDERRAISREIHDELGQQVTAINLDLKLAGRDVTSAAARNQLQRAIRESELLLESLHRFAQRVRPSILDDLGLVEAINSHVRDFQQRTGIKVEVQHDLCKASIGEVQSENVFRLLQESLTNVARHANASRVQVELCCVPSESPTMLALTVADDGNGRLLKPAADGQRLGVLGMQERVTLLNGRIDFDSIDDCGTVVRIQIPLYANNKEDQAR